MAGSDRLSPAQHRGVLAVLTEPSAAGAAEAAGVSPRTLRRWRQSAAFVTALRAAARDQAREGTARLIAARAEAVDVLRAALHDRDPQVRVRAGLGLLDHGARALADDADERLARVEGVLSSWPDEPIAAGASRLPRLA